ncbi:hypothetical protein [Streptomyces sp. Da 82-17]|uniref:hypothetical protein n=1 Tax=Streptomyces sp. Da 82-17 TaxID=3377116 RepID=UPI0038D4FBE7
MSAPDQERDERPATERKQVPAGESGEGGERGGAVELAEGAESGADDAGAELAEDAESGADDDYAEDGFDEEPRTGLAPFQARRLRIAAAAVLMVVAAVVLAVRLASRSSVLVVGVYGLLLILCGIVIELSRRGRTRLGSWILGTGLIAALLADWRLLP